MPTWRWWATPQAYWHSELSLGPVKLSGTPGAVPAFQSLQAVQGKTVTPQEKAITDVLHEIVLSIIRCAVPGHAESGT